MDGRDGDGAVSKGEGWELRLGKWQDVMADVECDALIVDAPYSDRTHSGHDAGQRNDGSGARYGHREQTRSINYASWSPEDVGAFVASWAPKCRGWMVTITDHVLAEYWAAAMELEGRYAFAPLPMVEIGSRVRLSGDGPSTWTCWVVVSRPKTREFQRWGTLRGAYVYTGHGDRVVMGGKRLDAMRDLVSDYTRTGDLVIDPCAGGGTTLVAARMEGRRSIGAEMMPEHYDIARRRLAHLPQGTDRQPSLFGDDR